MTDNELLAVIANQITGIADFFLGAYNSIEGFSIFQPVSDITPLTRAEDPTSIRVVVANGGAANPIYVKENGNLIAVVPPDTSLTLPSSGKGEIVLDCAEGEDSTVAIATYQKSP